MDVMECREENRTRNRMIDGIVFVLLLSAVSAVTLMLFYRQTTGSPALYHSDMKAYILEMQGLESGYRFPYPIFFKLSALIHLLAGPELSVAVATMLLNSLGIVVTKLAFNHLALPALEDGLRSRRGKNAGKGDISWLAGIIISLAAVSLFFISMLYPPKGIYLPGIKYNYLGVFTANPFHNATYMAARPFAILAFLWFGRLLPVYEKGMAWHRGTAKDAMHSTAKEAMHSTAKDAVLGEYIMFALFLLLATMTKPSFTLVLVSAAGLIMLYRLFRTGFRNFVPTVQLGVCFIPTFLDLLYQYQGVFVQEEGVEGGLGFSFGEVWAEYCDNIPLAICLAVGFPLLALALNRKEYKKNTLFLFSWQLYLVSFAEAFFLYEKGFRKVDFNFSWGYMCGIFFCHFGALLLLLRMTAREIAGKPEGNMGSSAYEESTRNAAESKHKAVFSDCKTSRWIRIALLLLQWTAYFWHVVCGLYYFRMLFGGAMYY